MEEHHVRTLGKFFGQLKIKDIHLGHLREYQRARMANTGMMWMKRAGPSVINHEISVMQRKAARQIHSGGDASAWTQTGSLQRDGSLVCSIDGIIPAWLSPGTPEADATLEPTPLHYSLKVHAVIFFFAVLLVAFSYGVSLLIGGCR